MSEETMPDWAIQPGRQEIVENTGRAAVPVMMGFDAMRICLGMEPTTFTRPAVLRWMEIMR
jgi:hypothetical protein